LGGTRIPVEHVIGLRPTSDRVKETLFNWLSLDIEGARCLDLFAGTGALGIESLSRGASTVTFVENNPILGEAISALLTSLGISKAEVCLQDSINYIESCDTRFDIIFLDPPFKSDLLLSSLKLIAKRNLRPNGIVYVEFSKNEVELPKEWRKLKVGATKSLEYCLLTRC
jgi:16S rRNA (guanine966-N2)-methyltransferase